nr:carotenoid cleavage dioxygenase CCD4.1 [Verbascum giganteum]
MNTFSSSFLSKFPMNVSSLALIDKNSTNRVYSVPKICAHLRLNVVKKPSLHEKKIDNESLYAKILKSLDDFICEFMNELPLEPSNDPKHILVDNFAPVDELPPTACEVVKGSLPSSLDGIYIRNGPNPPIIPRGPYHLFDGDGMLHSIRISQGKATFCSRYVKTYKYSVERKIGYPVFVSPFSTFNNGFSASMARVIVLTIARVLLTGCLDPRPNGFGTANTSLALFGGHLFALCESDLPYAIKVSSDGDISTLHRHDFYTGDPLLRMTAHPKVDHETGQVFAFRSNISSPYLTFFRIDSSGKKGPDLPIFSMKGASLVHDFALTKNYVIFPDAKVELNAMEITRGRSPIVVNDAKVPRLGILRRDAVDESEVLWIEVPELNMSHCINAWEEDCDNRIVLIVFNVLSGLDTLYLFESSLEKITIDLKMKEVQRQPLSTENLELGVINPAYARKKNRYVYASIISQTPKAAGVIKLDLERHSGNCTVGSRMYGERCYGGETYFVPREHDNPTAEEDDGYLVTYMHNENSNESWFLVMNAKSPTLDIVATVRLPRRVPYGFHGLFVRETELDKL